MPFLHLTILPSIIIILSIILCNWLKKEQFLQYFKIYLLGILAGIIICIVFSFFKTIFAGSAHHLTILIKSLLIDGLLFSVLFSISLYFIFNFILDVKLTSTWSITSIMIFAYLGGIYTLLNIVGTFTRDHPDNSLIYFSFIAFLLYISIISGMGFCKFFDSYKIINKVLWAILFIGILSLSFAIYNYLMFYNYYEHYFFIAVFIIISIFFEIFDFKLFRSASR